MGGDSTVGTHILDESFPVVARCLNARSTQRIDWETETLLPMRRGGFFDDPIAFSSKDHGADAGPISPTLRACDFDASHANGGGPPAIAFHPTQDPIVSLDGTTPERVCGSVKGQASIAVAFKPSHFTRGKDGPPTDIYPPLSADADKGDQEALIFQAPMAVRRLTPTECERLQSFPDGWTLGFSDSVRYRMLGNVVCVNVAEWIGKRIVSINRIRPEDATLLGLEN